MDLDAAIRLIKRLTPRGEPWTGADISEDAKTATDTDDAIAAILNAVVASPTGCLFGDDCDLTVAYMSGAGSKKDADKDATIARLTAEVAEAATLRAEMDRSEARVVELEAAFRKVEAGLEFIAADDSTDDAKMAGRLLPIARAARAQKEGE